MVKREYIASIIDHTDLKPEAKDEDIKKLCEEADLYKFASVCINPCYVKAAREWLKDSSVKVCTVIGFPLGANTTAVKAFEAKCAVEDGADEVDMVINIGKLKAKEYEYVKNDIKAVVDAVYGKALVKVIIEACLLDDEEKVKACEAAVDAKADFVKTSTGFSKWGAKAPDVELMRKTVGDKMGVKAAGGIHSYEDAASMVEAGANRIGASASLRIIGK